MIKKGWQQLRQQKKNGISMAVVLCVSAFFVAFAAAILYTAGMLTAQSNLRLKQERCSQLAKSAADVLDQELQKYTNKDTTEAGSDSFYTFVNKFLDDSQYLDYSEDYPDATKYNFLVSDTDLSDLSKADSLPEGYGNIRIALTKEDIPVVVGQAHVSGDGWKDVQNAEQLLGTTGESKGVEAVALSVESGENQFTGGIEYQAHVQDFGWQNWTSTGNIAGTTGQGKHIEAMRIKLTGEVAKYADVYYRMHVANFGWLGWAKNGQDAGTSGYGYQVEAIQIKLVPKNTAAPGSTSNAFKKAPPRVENEMQARANFYSSSTPYLILVNRSTHKVGVFRGWQGSWQNVFYWDCSDGAPSTPTVEGIFTVGIRGYYFDSGASRCYWYTQFRGNYLFHSVLYNKNGTLRDGRLGMPLSHGCVRLDINNAKWIYDNIPSGTTVVVYH